MNAIVVLFFKFEQSTALRLLSAEDENDNHSCLLSPTSWKRRQVINRRMFLTKNGCEHRSCFQLRFNEADKFTAAQKKKGGKKKCNMSQRHFFSHPVCYTVHILFSLFNFSFSPIPGLLHQRSRVNLTVTTETTGVTRRYRIKPNYTFI